MSGLPPHGGGPPPPHVFFNQGSYQVQPQFTQVSQASAPAQNWNPAGFVGGANFAPPQQQQGGFNPYAAPPPLPPGPPPQSAVPSTSGMGGPSAMAGPSAVPGKISNHSMPRQFLVKFQAPETKPTQG